MMTDAKMPSLKDKIEAQAKEAAEAKAKVEKKEKTTKKKDEDK